ncbi:hypothetical protein ASPWEDRAFT_172739 [Aspergillus wentii DTO 134E9]|uniref:Rhodanese domain-containing protein n=1 Tax=Aspergillus wentii DTO 134E9 TaxID=1073089 RepID=A0A1L9RLY3_ASPWE|nr:uncharacterized protein ASPWEDRAFT_172739 [Aspergillus wentii DTO 134E9]OJJ35955.1 hypothetical protein ASPWEDRAFT_172739 [Aspergillus wentii DTO 134E9]
MDTQEPLKIVIVGGVGGGMAAAVRARRMNEMASITIVEKGEYISYANSGVPYVLGGLITTDTTLVLQTAAGLKARFNIDVCVNTELLAISRNKHVIEVQDLNTDTVYSLPYDKLILSQGAEPLRPQIEGIDSPNIFTLQTLSDSYAIRNHVVKHECRRAAIIGGGFIGLKAAENLYNLGLQITVIESNNHVFPLFDRDMAELLHTELRRQKVQLYLNRKIEQLDRTEDGYVCNIILDDGSTVSADLVVTATGIKAQTSVAREAGLAIGKNGVSVNVFMQSSDMDIYAIGDMVETEHQIAHRPQILALAGPANRQGRLAADHIFGIASPYRGNVGTFLSKVFNLTAGITGLSIEGLREIGYSPLWITVHLPDHAGYYPLSSQMTLRIAFEPFTGRLLGAQSIGRLGVDKRIDVLSTALQAGMSVFDLEHLELSYAPQYGSAKDPVNMAGFVGSNLLRGLVDIFYPGEFQNMPRDWQILDVRPSEDYMRGHAPSAINIPIDSLRDNISRLDKSRPVIIYSRVGYYGYIAYRILKQTGYKAANLDGGYELFAKGAFHPPT